MCTIGYNQPEDDITIFIRTKENPEQAIAQGKIQVGYFLQHTDTLIRVKLFNGADEVGEVVFDSPDHAKHEE